MMNTTKHTANRPGFFSRIRTRVSGWQFGRIAAVFLAVALMAGIAGQAALYQNFAPRLAESRDYFTSHVEEILPEEEGSDLWGPAAMRGYPRGYSRHALRREAAVQAAPLIRDSLKAGGILPLSCQDAFLLLGIAGAARLLFLTGRVLLALWMLKTTTRHGSSGVWAFLTLIAPVPVILVYFIYLATRNKCPNCGRIQPKDASYCPECGHPNSSACRNCGANIPESAHYCPSCGQPRSTNAE